MFNRPDCMTMEDKKMQSVLIFLEEFLRYVKGRPFTVVCQIMLAIVAATTAVTIVHSGFIWTILFAVAVMFCGAASCLIILDDQNGGMAGECRRLLQLLPLPFLENILQRFALPQRSSIKSSDEIGVSDDPWISFKSPDVLTSHSLERIYPWLNLTLPRRVDQALTNLLEIIITDYVTRDWYGAVQVRKNFANEIRVAIRYGASRLLRRLLTVDATSFIHHKVSKVFVEHISVFLCLRKLSKESGEGDLMALLQAHPELGHPFMKESSDESKEDLFYYRISTKVLNRLLPREFRHFKASAAILREVLTELVLKNTVDAFSEPHRINHLLNLALSRTTSVADAAVPATDLTPVSILKNLINEEKPTSTVQKVPLRQILKETTLKSSFEQHLKALNLEDFCKIRESISWINQFLDSPVLGASAIQSTYSSLMKLQRELEMAQSKGYSFPMDFLADVAAVSTGGPPAIPKLRSLASWKDMNEKLSALFDGILVPSFQETRLYHHLMMPPTEDAPRKRNGKRTGNSSASRSRPRAPHPEALHKLGETVRGALKDVPPVVNQTDNDLYEDYEGASDLPDDDFDDLDGEETAGKQDVLGATLRDLSFYDVTVLRAEKRRDDRGRIFMILNITVFDRGPLSPDLNKRWAVQRKYAEFYILDSKIKEFHGPMDSSNLLPPRKAWGQPSLEFVQRRVGDFERFLQFLVKQPKLRYSQMLYNFLATTMEFDTSGFPDLGLGKVIRNVPQILTQERGQNIESFVRSLLNIALPAKVKSVNDTSALKDEVISERGTPSPAPRHFTPVPCQPEVPDVQSEPVKGKAIQTVFHEILYLATSLLRVDPEMMGVVACCHSFAAPYVEELVYEHIAAFVHYMKNPEQVACLIDILGATLTSPAVVVDEEAVERGRLETLEKIRTLARTSWVDILCSGKAENVARIFLDLFQYKVLNKRLVMVLLDLVVLELFPEFDGQAGVVDSKL